MKANAQLVSTLFGARAIKVATAELAFQLPLEGLTSMARRRTLHSERILRANQRYMLDSSLVARDRMTKVIFLGSALRGTSRREESET